MRTPSPVRVSCWAVAAVAAVSLAAAPAPPPPDCGKLAESVRVPFARPVDFADLRSLGVRVSLNGGPPTVFQVDTGSVGVIVSAAEVPGFDGRGTPGSIAYSSSGIELAGVWTAVTVTFVDATDAAGHHPRAVVPVLAAADMAVTPGAVNGGRAKASRDRRPHMMGVGFGRGAEPHPERNPFLNLTAMTGGTMRRGYAITRDGYTLGPTAATVGGGYVVQRLKERPVPPAVLADRPGLKDWETSRGWAEVDGRRSPELPVLLDTGLTNMMVRFPDLAAMADLPVGTDVTVGILGGQLHYHFKVGDGDRVTPRRVTALGPTAGPPTLNTGLRALAIYDYLYDADGGTLGLRPTAPRP